MGKTSFVRYCIQEYEHNAYERFRRLPAGKSLIDYIVVAMFIGVMCAASIFLANFGKVASLAMISDSVGAMVILSIIRMGTIIPLIYFLKYALQVSAEPHLTPRQRYIRYADVLFVGLLAGCNTYYFELGLGALLLIPSSHLLLLILIGRTKVVSAGALPFTFGALIPQALFLILGASNSTESLLVLLLLVLSIAQVILCRSKFWLEKERAGALVLAAILLLADVFVFAVSGHIGWLRYWIAIVLIITVIEAGWNAIPLPEALGQAQMVIRSKALFLLIVSIQLICMTFPTPIQSRDSLYFLSNLPHDVVLFSLFLTFSLVIVCSEAYFVARTIGPYGAVEVLASAIGANEPDSSIHRATDFQKWCRGLERMTFIWQVYRAYAQPIVTWINLGFDDLDHRSVICSMLAALRDQYRRRFIEWNSTQAQAIGIIGVTVLVMTTGLVSNALFYMSPADSQRIRCDNNTTGSSPSGRASAPMANALISASKADGGAKYLRDFLYFPPIYLTVIDDKLGKAGVPALSEDFQRSMRLTREYNCHGTHSGYVVSLMVYHIVIALALLVAGRWFFMWIPLLPYRANLKRMSDLLDSLTVRTVTGRKRDMWAPARWIHTLFGNEQENTSVETPPVNARAVEAAFVRILRDSSNSYWRLFGSRYLRVSIPAPEITFVFDELDKLWAKGGVEQADFADRNGACERYSRDTAPQTAERRRAQRTNRLLSDIKRVISDSPARFIFIGGRLLHDEWLADMHSRSQILTSIFDSEIYVPSLLTDSTKESQRRNQKGRLDERIGSYFCMRWAEARERSRLRADEMASLLCPWLPIRPERELVFLDAEKGSCENGSNGVRVMRSDVAACPEWAARILTDLRYYVTYRSAGNPKRLLEILASLMRQETRPKKAGLRNKDPANDALRLPPPELLRIQFVADIYRHLSSPLERRLVHRDDKMALSAFYLTDYLFKFHRRAFCWNNIERMDEMTHIHRAPDIRELLGEILEHFSTRYLHPVVNGMYAYRFRSEISQEIEHISHYSETEMAAFNFTLDESQEMKNDYLVSLADNDQSVDILSTLGELYEYDQDYDSACNYYQRALRSVDAAFQRQHGKNALIITLSAKPPIFGQIGARNPAPPHRPALPEVQIPMSWSLPRLRLMLQIGMTYEQAGNLERAEEEYVAAYDLSRLLIDRYLGDEATFSALAAPPDSSWMASGGEVMKHASLLYQPLFALAWVAEKQWSDIDTSTTTIEKGLADLRTRLPFVREWRVDFSTAPHKVSHATFALIISDLHNKAGDLYFFKGRQVIPSNKIRDYIKQKKTLSPTSNSSARSGIQGYLLRAHFHYCMALHELRRYIFHRIGSSQFKLHIGSGEKVWPTLSSDRFPAFIFRASAGILSNMAEDMLARVNTIALLTSAPSQSPDGVPEIIDVFSWLDGVTAWLSSGNEKADSEGSPPDKQTADPSKADKVDAESLAWWFGEWDESSKRLRFGQSRNVIARLRAALRFGIVAAEFQAENGNFEDAARELLLIAQTACHYLWWMRLCQSDIAEGIMKSAGLGDVVSTTVPKGVMTKSFVQHLALIAQHSLRRADMWFRLARVDRCAVGDPTVVGNIIPPEAVTLACSLALVRIGDSPDDVRNAVELLRLWIPEQEISSTPDPSTIQQTLFNSLTLNRYPVLNRLNGLKVLIDSDILVAPLQLRKATVICQNSNDWLARIYEEFDTTFDRFAAPHLFPHTQIGQTAALYAVAMRNGIRLCGTYDHAPTSESVKRNAFQYLRLGIETYTMGQAHYERLKKFYYLYDDFNDRRMHYARAIEMAGWDISVLLRDYILKI